jgi:hypothetical protein
MAAHELVLTGFASGALAAWIVLLVVFALWRPAGSAAAGDADDEPPALVNFLVNGARPTGAGYPATILELASRGYLTVTDRAGRPWCSGPRGAVDATRLDPVDAHVLGQVGSRLSGVDGAPFAALAGAQSGVPEQQWWQPFLKLVRAQAHERGLVAKRLSPVQRLLLLGAAVPVAVLAVHVAAAYSATVVGIWVSVIGFPMVVFGVAANDKLTTAGRALARRWTAARHEYRLAPGESDLLRAAYAVALGLPHPASAGFTASGRPTAAWSSLGGIWRLVRVERRPRRIRAVPVGSWVVVGGATAVVAALHQMPARFAVAAAAVLVAGWVWVLVRTVRWLAQRLSTPPVVDIDGQLIARWQEEESDEDSKVIVHYGAVDDGTRAWTWVLRSDDHQRVPVGSAVHVRADPRRGELIDLWVRAVPVAPAPLAPVLAANAPADPPSLGGGPAIDVSAVFSATTVSQIVGRSLRVIRCRPNLVVLRGGGRRFTAFASSAAVLGNRVAGMAGVPVPELGPEARLTGRERSLTCRIGSVSLRMTLRGMPTGQSGPALIALGRLAMATTSRGEIRDRPPGRPQDRAGGPSV